MLDNSFFPQLKDDDNTIYQWGFGWHAAQRG